MLNPFHDVNWHPDLAGGKKFAVSLMIGFPAIAIFFSIVARFSQGAWKPFFLWLGAIGFAVGLLLWLVPQIARPFYLAWYFVACCMGFVIGNVLFSVFYYGMITPIGLLLRACRRAPFEKTFDRRKTSYWRDAEKVVDLKQYYRQF